MGLITCVDCGKAVSDRAAACPHCGGPIHKDLVELPAAGSAEAAKRGRQRSKLRNDLGNALALVGIIAAIFIGAAAGSIVVGFIVAVVSIGIGIKVGYGS